MSKTISLQTLQQWLSEGKPVDVIDARTPDDFDEWSIPGSRHADLFYEMKDGRFDGFLKIGIPADKPSVLVCYAGRTSGDAANFLCQCGFDAYSLEGGMQAWSLAWNKAELKTPSAQIVQIRRTGKGCLSYLVVSQGEALVIDPAIGVEDTLSLLESYGARLIGIADTHVHADHLTRARQLSAKTGAPFYLPENNRVSFEYTPLPKTIEVGATHLSILKTPGHTWESVCLLIDGEALFTGDTLFVDSIGRPDLATKTGESEERAKALYASLQMLKALPGDPWVLPAHTDHPAPFDGRPIAKRLTEVVADVSFLKMSEPEFLDTILSRIPATPPNHLEIVRLNEAGEFPLGDPTDLEAGANRCAVK